MNVLYCCCITEPWLDVAKRLKEENYQPKYWIGWNDDNEGRIQKDLPEVTYHDIDLAWKGLFPDSYNFLNQPKLDGFELAAYSFEELMAIKMQDRLDPDQSSFSFNERQQFYRRLLRQWINLLQQEDISLVIAPTIPHRVFDYAIYIATGILGIKFLSFKMTPWPGHLIPVNKITEVPKFPFNATGSHPSNNISEDVLNFISKVRGDYEEAEPDYMKNQQLGRQINIMRRGFNLLYKKNIELLSTIFEPSNSYWKKDGQKYSESVYRNYEKLIQKYRGLRFKKELKSQYESLCKGPNYDDTYLFVALHYQPEETSCPSGNIYVDQSIMIEALLKFFPENVKIYVKEHPSQFSPKLEGETGRNIDFYKSVKKFDRVQFISNNIDSFKLIDRSLSVVTLTGTVGIEALIRNKPVIILGNAWYEHLPGTFKINEREDLIKLSHSIMNDFYFSEENLIKSLDNLYKSTLKANHYQGVAESSSLTNKESVENLVEYISTNY